MRMKSLKYLTVEIMLDELEKRHWIAEEDRILQSLEEVQSRKFEKFELIGLPFSGLFGDHPT